MHGLEGTNSAVTLGGHPSPHGGEKGAIASTRGALVCLQGVPNIFACGNQGTIPEPYVEFYGDCEMEGEEKDQHGGMMGIHPYPFQELSTQERETALRRGEEQISPLIHAVYFRA